MLHHLIPTSHLGFSNPDDVLQKIKTACKSNPATSEFISIGESEEGRSIYGIKIGFGQKKVSLIAGAHSDEPAGPATLRNMVLQILWNPAGFKELIEHFTFLVIPHINPDGEAINQKWIQQFPDYSAYAKHVMRELPGRDIEFGFPDMRKENQAVAKALKDFGPVHMHVSLHGMSVAEGGMLLINKSHVEKTTFIREKFATALAKAGLGLHDHDRKGEKGFHYISPGFTSTPSGKAMQEHFVEKGDEETASKFKKSSMEYVESLGNKPLCLVTELPLFLITKKEENTDAIPTTWMKYREQFSKIRELAQSDSDLSSLIDEFGLQPVELAIASKLQLQAIHLGLEFLRNQPAA